VAFFPLFQVLYPSYHHEIQPDNWEEEEGKEEEEESRSNKKG